MNCFLWNEKKILWMCYGVLPSQMKCLKFSTFFTKLISCPVIKRKRNDVALLLLLLSNRSTYVTLIRFTTKTVSRSYRYDFILAELFTQSKILVSLYGAILWQASIHSSFNFPLSFNWNFLHRPIWEKILNFHLIA